MLDDADAREVLRQYAAATGGDLVALAGHGGFSGAKLWRVAAGARSFCLKAWPADDAAPLDWVHGLLAQAARLPWMPRVLATAGGGTVVRHRARQWDLQTWLPGIADFAAAPTPARLRSACMALAQLHQAWVPAATSRGVCPAIVRRCDSWQTWQRLRASGWKPTWKPLDPYAATAESLWRAVQSRIDDVPAILTRWHDRLLPLQPCVCDLWHDHVLFTGDAVSGLVDFGSVKIDNVAVDLARMIGSLIGADEAGWQAGFAAYESIRPLSPDERVLARDLDRTGTILAATHWLRWLYHDDRQFDHPAAVLRRLHSLLELLTPN